MIVTILRILFLLVAVGFGWWAVGEIAAVMALPAAIVVIARVVIVGLALWGLAWILGLISKPGSPPL